MEEPSQFPEPDRELLKKFHSEIKAKVPYLHQEASAPIVVNATPLVDLTRPFLECARAEYGLEVSSKNAKVFGKFDSQIFGGSVKVRPAVRIVEAAIVSGKLRTGQTIFEATSGNFGLALGMFRRLGLEVIVLVSRKLQEGVLEELKKDSVKLVDLDIDICPAPGLNIDTNTVVARSIMENLRQQLSQLGLDKWVFENSRAVIERLLARQDVINLAKQLAKVYGGFCPEQYDNELNVAVHETMTGPEIDQQLTAAGDSLADYRIVCTFGTGGTSTGLSNYVQQKYGRKSVHVVFPLSNQDVAGIRTKDKALGLRFYKTGSYAGQHEVDFEASKRTLRFFANKGYDIGESSALALYACLQMLNYGVAERFVVIIADGIQKYGKTIEALAGEAKRLEVTFDQASSSMSDYGEVLWTHTMFVPKEEGIKLIASSLGCDEDRIKVARAQDVQTLISTQELPETMKNLLPKDKRGLLLVCMAGQTSLRVAEILAMKGTEAVSITGGIMNVAEASDKSPSDLVQIARE